MEKHITLLGILYLAYHITSLIAVLMIILVFLVIGFASQGVMNNAVDIIPYMPLEMFGLIGWIIGSLLLLVSLPGIIAGVGLMRLKPWSRILALVVAIFNLFSFPIGTALSIFALWVLFSEESQRVFNKPS